MISNIHRRKVFVVLLVLSILSLGIGCKDEEKIQAEKKAEHWEQAKKYMANGQYPEAVIEFQNVIQIDPTDKDALYEIGIAFQRQNKHQEAFDSFVKTISIDNGYLKAHLKLGQIFLLAKQANAARSQVDRLMKEKPENLEVLTLLSGTQVIEGDIDSAIETLEKTASIYPDDVKTQLTLGHLYLGKGDMDKADQANVKAAELNPNLKKLMIRQTDSPYQSIPVLVKYFENKEKWDQAEKLYLDAFNVAEDKVPPLKHLAAFYSRADNYEKALDALKQAFSIRDELNIMMQIAQLHFKFNHVDDAETIVDDILDRMGGYTEANMLKGRICFLKKDYSGAIHRFDLVVRASPRNAGAHYYRGISLAEDGDIEPALQALEEALELNPDLEEARMRLAGLYILYFPTDKLSLASQHLEAVLKQTPDHRKALSVLGNLKIRTRDFEGAEKIFNKIVQQYPDQAAGYVKLGLLYEMTKRHEKALGAYEKAVALDPLQTKALKWIIDIHIKNKAFKKALRICREKEKRIGNHQQAAAEIENFKGRVYLAKGDFVNAQKHFEASVQKDINNLSSHIILAQLYLRDKDVNQVISHFEDAVGKNPKFLQGYMVLGIIYNRQGDKEKSETSYRKALEVKKDFAPAANNLAWSLAGKKGEGHIEEALQLARVAKEKLPNNPHVLDTLGWVLYRMGYYGKAIIELEKSVSILPNHTLYNYHLAKAYYENNQRVQAKTYFEKALKLNPNFAGAEGSITSLLKFSEIFS